MKHPFFEELAEQIGDGITAEEALASFRHALRRTRPCPEIVIALPKIARDTWKARHPTPMSAESRAQLKAREPMRRGRAA